MKNFYEDKFRKHGESVKSLGWGSRFSQEKRFEALLGIGIENNDTVIDVGCGFCDFYEFAKRRGINLKYWGVEMCSPIYDKISTKYKNDCNLNLINADYRDESFKIRNRKKYKWVIASGLFCFDSEENSDKERLVENIKILFEMAERGLAVNFLSSESKGKILPGFKHYNSEVMLDLIKHNVSLNSRVVKDYLHNDFTILIYQNEGR